MEVRRRSPWWVREMKVQALHRLGGKLLNDYRNRGLTAKEEYLWGAVISELEYRSRRQPPVDRCTCLLCCSPFPNNDEDPLDRLERV